MAIYMLLVHKKFTIAALAATVFIGFCSPAGAQGADERLYVVTHVDVLGPNGAATPPRCCISSPPIAARTKARFVLRCYAIRIG